MNDVYTMAKTPGLFDWATDVDKIVLSLSYPLHLLIMSMLNMLSPAHQ